MKSLGKINGLFLFKLSIINNIKKRVFTRKLLRKSFIFPQKLVLRDTNTFKSTSGLRGCMKISLCGYEVLFWTGIIMFYQWSITCNDFYNATWTVLIGAFKVIKEAHCFAKAPERNLCALIFFAAHQICTGENSNIATMWKQRSF